MSRSSDDRFFDGFDNELGQLEARADASVRLQLQADAEKLSATLMDGLDPDERWDDIFP